MTIGQVLLKWSIQKGSVPYKVTLNTLDISADVLDLVPRSNHRYCPQAKTSSPARLKENLDVLRLPPLSEESMHELERMNLEGREEEVGRLALEWNPVDCP
jgi:diketogulonate reductase-like aldo/keto reductase